MSSNSDISYIIKNEKDRRLFTCGSNSYYMLGIDSTASKANIFSDTSMNDVKQVCSGKNHIVLLKTNGTVWGCGSNSSGQLGKGAIPSIEKKFATLFMDNVSMIACGLEYTMLVKSDGTLYASGDNYYGQLGLGDTKVRRQFTKVDIDNVKYVACGEDHTIIIKNDNTVFACGNNSFGQLGLGSGSNTTYNTFTKLDISDVAKVSLGFSHSLILTNQGEVYSFGRNHNGELGLGHNNNMPSPTKVDIDNVENIECGSYLSILVKSNKSVWGTGYNYYGSLGNGNYSNINTFTRIMTSVNSEDIVEIYCGLYHTIIVMNDGTVFSTGRNNYGQLGLGDSTGRNTFTQIDAEDIVSAGNNWNYDGGGTSSMSYLVKSHNKYHTIENSQLVEITDIITEDVINDKGITIDTINDNKDILPDEYSLISAAQSELELNANQLTMIAMKNEIDIDALGKFKELTMEGNNLTDNVRVLLKVNGKNILNYKSYSTDNISWHDLLFTLEELSDIPSLNIPELDKAKKVLVAFLFKNTDLETKTLINKIVMKYDKSGDIISINDENVRYSEDGLKIEFTNNVNKALVDVVKTIK